MPEVLANTLSDTAILGTDGETLGTVHNVTMDVTRGSLEHVVVDPADGQLRDFETAEDGCVRLPAECIRALDDYLVVDQSVIVPTGDPT